MKPLALSRPHLIVMVGVPGSGKSFFAEKFAETFHAPYVSLQKIHSIGTFDKQTTHDLIHYQLDELFKTRQTIIIDTAMHSRSDRADLAKLARAADYEPLFIWVQIDQASAKSRYLKLAKSAENKKELMEQYDKQLAHFTPPNILERPLVISGKHTYATQVKVVLTKLSSPRPLPTPTAPLTPAPARPDGPTRRNISIG